MYHIQQISATQTELIDTLWNVNVTGQYRLCDTDRINRYIMECKYFLLISFSLSAVRINRYIMECKCLLSQQHCANCAELIDTLWNVNFF